MEWDVKSISILMSRWDQVGHENLLLRELNMSCGMAIIVGYYWILLGRKAGCSIEVPTRG